MQGTQIRFINADGQKDQTEFDTTQPEEIYWLWYDFCLENRIITTVNTSINIEFKTGAYDSVDLKNDVSEEFIAMIWYDYCKGHGIIIETETVEVKE